MFPQPGDKIKVFAPATVANVACGFDVLGFALESPGDELELTVTEEPGIIITDIEGDKGQLPRDPARNSATVAIHQYMEAVEAPFGISVKIFKNMPGGSGLGSSAASAVAGVFAINEICGRRMSRMDMMPFLLHAEYVACGSAIADNVASSLFGGFILVRSYEPLEIVPIPTPDELFAAVIYPHLTVLTKEAREMLPKEIPLAHSLRQSANLGGLLIGLMNSDYDLIGRSLVDYIAEPYRSRLIPGFFDMKKAAMDAGALGGSISGSGPSVFTLCKGKETAGKAAAAMQEVMSQKGISSDIYVSKVNASGPRVL